MELWRKLKEVDKRDLLVVDKRLVMFLFVRISSLDADAPLGVAGVAHGIASLLET